MIPVANMRHFLGPYTIARAKMAKIPGPGVIPNMNMAMKNVMADSSDTVLLYIMLRKAGK
ncbi:hypothetical protein VIBRN418_15543 [Vibrio sp. N418]|nr:hypothetical protein VIBRN418_15543 [Vibrio sp. N418]